MNDTTEQVLEKVAAHATHILTEETPNSLEYHDLAHTKHVVEAAKEIGEATGLNDDEMEVLQVAAWFHDTGHSRTIENHEEASKEIAKAFLNSIEYPQEKIGQVTSAINATKMPQTPKNTLEEVLCDADLSHLGDKTFKERASMLRNEQMALGNQEYSDEDWHQINMDFIQNHSYFTEYGKTILDKQKKKNIKKLEKKIDKLHEKKDDMLQEELGVDRMELKKLKKKLEKVQGRPERGIETMFRVTSRNHVDLSAMADTKANIMISVNSILITIIIGVLMRKLDNNPHLIIPTALLMVVCLAAIVFAIFATRPSVTSGKFTKEDIENKRANLLFFGNFHRMSLQDFEWGMNQMINDADYLYGSMIRDIYFLGAVLGKKYKFLRTSYTIFMYGLIIASIAFMIATIMYGSGEPTAEDTIF